ncbi:hypothetical protein BDD12DRAFT_764950 [Trichophaea hybrida]|nr:hypothetical protein BDD12DRAFT_764950 [Trichophaea hybrida]
MFCPGVHSCVNGALIDRPYNGITMIHQCYRLFGRLKLDFEEVPGKEHTYIVHTTRGTLPIPYEPPKEICFRNNDPNVSCSLPSRSLLRVHAACCKILGASGAAEYVDKILRDRDEISVLGTLAEDGSTELYSLWMLKGLVDAQA